MEVDLKLKESSAEMFTLGRRIFVVWYIDKLWIRGHKLAANLWIKGTESYRILLNSRYTGTMCNENPRLLVSTGWHIIFELRLMCRRVNISDCDMSIVGCSCDGLILISHSRNSSISTPSHLCCTLESCSMSAMWCLFKIPLLGNYNSIRWWNFHQFLVS